MLKEIRREVGLSNKSQNMEYLGFINDDDNDVGKVHMGVVFKNHCAFKRC